MKRYLTVGVFDIFHYGHLRLFKQIKELDSTCELIVAVQKDSYILKYKPNTKVYYNQNIRKEFLSSIKEIQKVIFYTDVDRVVQEQDFDVFCLGEDQNHSGFMKAVEYCKNHNKEVLYLKRTPDISSTDIRNFLESLYNNGGGGKPLNNKEFNFTCTEGKLCA